MKCPECGNVKCGYVTKKKENKSRDNFKAKCKKCGFEFDAREHFDVVSTVKQKEEVKPTKIKMKYDE